MTCDISQLTAKIQGACPTSPKVEIVQLAGLDCSVIACVTKTTTYAVVNGVCTATWVYTHPTVSIPANPTEVTTAIAPVQLVKNFTTDAIDCAGATLTVQGVQGQTVQTVPHPTAVQKVQLCKTGQDREMVMLCAPDGAKVIVQNITPDDAPLGTAPVFEAWVYPTAAPYTGSLAALADCGSGDTVDPVTTDYCATGINYSRVDGMNTAGVSVWTVWLDDAGIPVTAPVGATKGVCQVAEFDSEVTTELGCAAGVQYSRVTRRLYDKAGAFVSATAVYVDAMGASSATMPAGFALGDCGCAPVTTSGLQPVWGF